MIIVPILKIENRLLKNVGTIIDIAEKALIFALPSKKSKVCGTDFLLVLYWI